MLLVVVVDVVLVVVVLVVVVVLAHPPVGPVHSKLLLAVKIQSPVQGDGAWVVDVLAGFCVVVTACVSGCSATHLPSLCL